jgi:hypothetical protein
MIESGDFQSKVENFHRSSKPVDVFKLRSSIRADHQELQVLCHVSIHGGSLEPRELIKIHHSSNEVILLAPGRLL